MAGVFKAWKGRNIAHTILRHLGSTTSANTGAGASITLDDCVDLVDPWSAAALAKTL